MRTRTMMVAALALGTAMLGAAGPIGAAVAAATMSAAPARDGAALFNRRCGSCHEEGAGIGPDLTGVVGHKAASTSYRYSPALTAAKPVWTRANLDRFLAGPQQMVPGTRMVASIADPADRAAIIDYLARAH